MIELSLQVSFTKRQHARSLYQKVQPKLTYRVSFSNSVCASFDLGSLFLHHNSHINNFVCVLILENLAVLGLVVDFLLGGPGRLHFDSFSEFGSP